jgi:hypothetical protein
LCTLTSNLNLKLLNYLILWTPKSEEDSDDPILVSDFSHPVEVIDDGEEDQRMNDDRRRRHRRRRGRRNRRRSFGFRFRRHFLPIYFVTLFKETFLSESLNSVLLFSLSRWWFAILELLNQGNFRMWQGSDLWHRALIYVFLKFKNLIY